MPQNRIANVFGTWDFVSISGHPDLPGMELETITKNGVDGAGFREGQFRAEETPIYLTGIGVNYADMVNFVANMKNLQGTQATLWTSAEVAYHGVVIKRSVHLNTKAMLVQHWQGVTYPNSYRIRWQLTVQWPYGSF